MTIRPTGNKPSFHLEEHVKNNTLHVDMVVKVGSFHVKFDVAWWAVMAQEIEEMIIDGLRRRAGDGTQDETSSR